MSRRRAASIAKKVPIKADTCTTGNSANGLHRFVAKLSPYGMDR